MRPLILDECISHRLATHVSARGRYCVSAKSLGLPRADHEIIEVIWRHFRHATFVTADDAMPVDHPLALQQRPITLAIIDGHIPPAYSRHTDFWPHDVVHRWAHLMQAQADGSIVRYGARPAPWRPRRGGRLR